MRRLLLALAAVSLLGGCAAPEQVTPSVELVLGDDRVVRRPEAEPFGLYLLLVPLVPFQSWSADVSSRSLLPEAKAALRESGRFGAVLGPGDPGPARRAAPWVVEVTIEETRQTRVATSYGLGFVGLLLHALGAPQRYTSITVRARVACGPRDGPRPPASNAETELTLRWIYEDDVGPEEQEALAEAVRQAVVDGVEESLEATGRR